MMTLELSSDLFISGAPSSFVSQLRATLTIENPAYLDAKKMGRYAGDLSQVLRYYDQDDTGITVPRGLVGLVIYMAKRAGLPWHIEDNTRALPPVEFRSLLGSGRSTTDSTPVLKPFQVDAVAEILKRDTGVLQLDTGAGKTVIALGVIAERKQPTLIIVHSKPLLNQWVDRIATFLGIPKEEIGVIGNGKKTIGKKITVGIINSIYPIADGIKRSFGHIVVDECHRCPSRTFTGAVTAFDAKYVLGLSATPWRRDGLTKLIGWYLGPQVKVEPGELTEKDIIQDVEIITRETAFIPFADPAEEYSTALSELCEDPQRNNLICRDVATEAGNGGGTCLVLSDRKSHCDALASTLRAKGVNADVLTGDTAKKEREGIVGRLNSGSVRVLIATGQLIGEGFDAKSLQTIFLTTPVSFDGRLIQYLGRVLRPAAGKQKARVYDYIDPVGVLRASARTRQRVYESKGWRAIQTGGEG
jgi:superfamily II DNA or RNA helicase